MKYLMLCIVIPGVLPAMQIQNKQEIKQKVARAVSERIVNASVIKQQPYMARMLKYSIEQALMNSRVEIYEDRGLAEVDYEHQRFCVNTKNPYVLTVHNIVHENVSER